MVRLGYQFTNLCGTVFKCGNVVFTPDGNKLVSPVGNRVTVFDLVEHSSVTLPIETRSNIARVAVSHDGRLLICVDVDGYCVVINLARRILLHRFNFKAPVRDIQFSPDDGYIAVSHRRKVQVWRTPGLRREFSPFVLHRVFTGHFDDVTCIAWSPSGRYFVTGSKDATVRMYSLQPVKGFVPITLSGHRGSIVGAAFSGDGDTLYTVSKDAALFEWKWKAADALPASVLATLKSAAAGSDAESSSSASDGDDDSDDDTPAVRGSARALATRTRRRAVPHPAATSDLSYSVLEGEWHLNETRFFNQDHAKVHSMAFHAPTDMVVVGFSSGIFGIYMMPDFSLVHTLSVSQRSVQTAAINPSGEWLAFGSRALGQLLVWEWQSETYVLKQQGHFYDLNALAYSADGTLIATGGDDGKVKLWSTTSGFCFVTFTDHTAPVTALCFVPGRGGRGNVIVSTSLDGSVRAYDMTRYRNFRTMTSPAPAQFISLATDPSGEVVCAGAMEPFEIYMWSLQTGKLLDVFSGHEGPVCGLAFSPNQPILASCSWDKTVKVWDVYRSGSSTETYTHRSDVLALAFRPDGHQLCSSSREGTLSFWGLKHGNLEFTIEARMDAAGGRRAKDLRTAKSSAVGKCFTSLAYSADGTCVLAGGRSKFVCLYAVAPRLLLRRFQLSHNRSLDGMLDKLNSKGMAAGGALADVDAPDSEDDGDDRFVDSSLPGVKRGDLTTRTTAAEVRSKCVRFSPSGNAFAAASTEGLVIFSLDPSLTFAPFDLDEDVTLDTMALHLNETSVIDEVVEAVPVDALEPVVGSVPGPFLQRLFEVIAAKLSSSPHLEYFLRWSLAMLHQHGRTCQENAAALLGSLRMLQRSVLVHRDGLSRLCDDTKYTLEFLSSAPPADSHADASPPAPTAGAGVGTVVP